MKNDLSAYRSFFFFFFFSSVETGVCEEGITILAAGVMIRGRGRFIGPAGSVYVLDWNLHLDV